MEEVNNFGTATINYTTITGNSTQGSGGSGISNSGILVIQNSTTSGNLRGTGQGGGIVNTGSGTIVINNSTISYNQGLFAGGIISEGTQITFQNSIISRNMSTYYSTEANCSGTINSLGYNLIGNNSNCTFVPTTGDLVGTSSSPINPRLTILQDYGGGTFNPCIDSW